jgi:hypothetical protein
MWSAGLKPAWMFSKKAIITPDAKEVIDVYRASAKDHC